MPSGRPDPITLLKSLDGRVKIASEHFKTPQPRRREAPPLEALLPHAERIHSGASSCLRVTTRADLSGGRSKDGYVCPVDPFDARDTGESFGLLARDAAWSNIDPARVAYIDTETTGLSGASGTYAFLIGIGRFDATGFTVRQYFMEDYDAEEALLDAVSDDLRDAEAFVSYNGKCFDVPLLATRWRMSRRVPRFPQAHLDLLFPARRLWRLRLPDCRLGTVEREVLGVMRFSDIESSQIPQIFFDYARGTHREMILPVFDHHAQDIYSLAALAAAMARAVEQPDDPRFGEAGEQWGLSRMLHSAGRREAAISALERACLAARDESLAFRLAMHLAKQLQRAGRSTEAFEIWKARAGRVEALIELAKHAEHTLRDFRAALGWTERAMQIAELSADAKLSGDLERRMARLVTRIRRD